MGAIYVKSIRVHHLYHLQNFEIRIADAEQCRHLVITGPNGTGKTLLLNAIAEHLDNISLNSAINNAEKLDLSIANMEELPKSMAEQRFVIAYYNDQRRPDFKEVTTPEKPNLEYKGTKTSKVGEFIKFLVDLKIQRALAEGEKATDYAKEIEEWFDNLEHILRRLFSDDHLKLQFDYKTYSFFILSEGKRFKFTELSAGYSAALDIIVDLILKMQDPHHLTRAFNMHGIVMVDEIETHLHLKMQREILPLLTTLFPNIQLIVTTHSPFVLNSLPNAVAYDLAHREEIADLTNYSYDSLAEGYFEVDTTSSKLQRDLNRLETLAGKREKTTTENNELKRLLADIDNIPIAVAPSAKGRYYDIVSKMNVLQTSSAQ